MKSKLTDYFTGYAYKYLSAVDANPVRSNQHEIGSNKLKQILGDPGSTGISFHGKFIYLGQDENDCFSAMGMLTFYDSRLRQIHRGPEYRLYYRDNIVTEMMLESDFLLIIKLTDNTLLVIVTPKGTSTEQRLMNLFGINKQIQTRLDANDDIPSQDVTFVERFILEEIGLETEIVDDNYLEWLVRKYGQEFPSTRDFSAFAREVVKTENDYLSQLTPDALFSLWIEKEEMLFRTFENYLVSQKLEKGFNNVDEFVGYSLSVQNRRKARAGLSLENHLEAIFAGFGIMYSRGKVTENNAKPDFLFPGIEQYRDPALSSEYLTMLGVKSTCKDRWRQVLTEAYRINRKHLFTLEPGISVNQTNEMNYYKLQLVLPESLHKTYTSNQRSDLLTLQDFLGLVKTRQGEYQAVEKRFNTYGLRVATPKVK